MKVDVRKLILGGFLIALGVLLPQAVHLAGGASLAKALSPMHIPVFIAGLFLGPVYGMIVGGLTPLLSFLTTGMPAFPMVIFMLFELMAYGAFSGLFMTLFKKSREKVHISLVLSMICGRLVYAGVLYISNDLLHIVGAKPVSSILAGLSATYGLLSIVIQLILVPMVVVLLQKTTKFGLR